MPRALSTLDYTHSSKLYCSTNLKKCIIINYFKISNKIIIQYIIPEGYEIVEIPEKIIMSLPGKAASFQFQVSSIGNMVQVISDFNINLTVFQYFLYPALKNFYNFVIEKQNEKIVFKKKD